MIVRKVEPKDVAAVIQLIKGLAEFEHDLDAVENTTEKLNNDLFNEKYCEAFVAEMENVIVGFALFYTSYSTWKGPCIYLEDLFVLSEHRSLGIGSKLFDEVINTAKERKVSRMDWQILDWNQEAIDFYKKKGAQIDSDWLNGRLFFTE